MTAPLCFLDTETDGVHPDRRVWEVALLRRDERGERSLSCFVDIDLATADPFGLKVGRFYDRHPYGRWLSGLDAREDAPTPYPELLGAEDAPYVDPDVAAALVARWTHGAHIVGMVPNFDTEVLDGMLRRRELLPAWHYHLTDVEVMARGWLLASGVVNDASWRSDSVSRACGVEPPGDEERHTALGDVRWAARLYDALHALVRDGR